MKVIGVVLIVLGVLGFALGGLKFKRKEKVADLGPLEVSQSHTERIPIAPVAAGAALVAGIILVVVGSGRRNA
jgi:uncharacterized membrane protein YidH (DUF202 family)